MLKCVDAHVNNDVEKMRSQKISVKSKNPVRFVKPNRTLGDLKMWFFDAGGWKHFPSKLWRQHRFVSKSVGCPLFFCFFFLLYLYYMCVFVFVVLRALLLVWQSPHGRKIKYSQSRRRSENNNEHNHWKSIISCIAHRAITQNSGLILACYPIFISTVVECYIECVIQSWIVRSAEPKIFKDTLWFRRI